jgi:tetratricopeptide (TPR) repeat protein
LVFTPEILNEPENNILFAHIASILLDRGKLDDAINICEAGLKKVPSYAQGHFILARCYQLKNKPDQAKAEFERVLRYDPNHIAAIREIALFHRRNKMDDMYKRYLYQLLTLDPTNDIVIEEAKNAGVYFPWIHPNTEVKDAVTDDEKLDLSQFENRDDDFTTIMHGLFKPEDKAEIEHDLKSVEQIREPEEEEIIADEVPFENDSYDYSLKTHDDLIQSLDAAPEDAMSDEEIQSPNDEEFNVLTEQTHVEEDEVIREDPEEVEEQFEQNILDIEEISLESQRNQDETTIIFEGEISIETDHVSGKDKEQEETYPEDDEDANRDVYNNNPKLISQTLAEILVSQKKYLEARNMFKALKEKDPANTKYDKKIEFLTRIIELNQQL